MSQRDERNNAQGKASADSLKGHRPRTSIYKDELARLREKAKLADEYLNDLRRVQAEFVNFKRRWEKERQQMLLFGEEELIKELLPVLDNLERAIKAADQTGPAGPILDGIKMVYDQVMDILKKRGLRRIEAKGKEFDPNLHEAVGQELTDQVPDNHVFDELQPGYILRDRLIRPAMVRVAKLPH